MYGVPWSHYIHIAIMIYFVCPRSLGSYIYINDGAMHCPQSAIDSDCVDLIIKEVGCSMIGTDCVKHVGSLQERSQTSLFSVFIVSCID